MCDLSDDALHLGHIKSSQNATVIETNSAISEGEDLNRNFTKEDKQMV